MVRIDGEYKV